MPGPAGYQPLSTRRTSSTCLARTAAARTPAKPPPRTTAFVMAARLAPPAGSAGRRPRSCRPVLGQQAACDHGGDELLHVRPDAAAHRRVGADVLERQLRDDLLLVAVARNEQPYLAAGLIQRQEIAGLRVV